MSDLTVKQTLKALKTKRGICEPSFSGSQNSMASGFVNTGPSANLRSMACFKKVGARENISQKVVNKCLVVRLRRLEEINPKETNSGQPIPESTEKIKESKKSFLKKGTGQLASNYKTGSSVLNDDDCRPEEKEDSVLDVPMDVEDAIDASFLRRVKMAEKTNELQELEDLRTFETLEQKVNDNSFVSSSCLIKNFINTCVNSTPKKSIVLNSSEKYNTEVPTDKIVPENERSCQMVQVHSDNIVSEDNSSFVDEVEWEGNNSCIASVDDSEILPKNLPTNNLEENNQHVCEQNMPILDLKTLNDLVKRCLEFENLVKNTVRQSELKTLKTSIDCAVAKLNKQILQNMQCSSAAVTSLKTDITKDYNALTKLVKRVSMCQKSMSPVNATKDIKTLERQLDDMSKKLLRLEKKNDQLQRQVLSQNCVTDCVAEMASQIERNRDYVAEMVSQIERNCSDIESLRSRNAELERKLKKYEKAEQRKTEQDVENKGITDLNSGLRSINDVVYKCDKVFSLNPVADLELKFDVSDGIKKEEEWRNDYLMPEQHEPVSDEIKKEEEWRNDHLIPEQHEPDDWKPDDDNNQSDMHDECAGDSTHISKQINQDEEDDLVHVCDGFAMPVQSIAQFERDLNTSASDAQSDHSMNTSNITYPDYIPPDLVQVLRINGQRLFNFNSETIEIHYKDGTIRYTNGPDETLIKFGNGECEMHMSAVKMRWFLNGSFRILYGNKATHTTYPNGNIILKDSQGNCHTATVNNPDT